MSRAADPTEREVLVPRTLPARTIDDFAVYHWARTEDGRLSLRKGAPPKQVMAAIAEYATGGGSLNDMLDKIGVAKA